MSAGKIRLSSKAFRRGLKDGFGAPALFFAPTFRAKVYYTRDYDITLREAWQGVSLAIDESLKAERDSGGKTKQTHKTARAPKDRCPAFS
jgi:hypothetical protein